MIGFDNIDFAKASVPEAQYRYTADSKDRAGSCRDPDHKAGGEKTGLWMLNSRMLMESGRQ